MGDSNTFYFVDVTRVLGLAFKYDKLAKYLPIRLLAMSRNYDSSPERNLLWSTRCYLWLA
jgi:hypothetical protein